MSIIRQSSVALFLVFAFWPLSVMADLADNLRINQIQFVGSHNSYKQAMSQNHFQALTKRNPTAARGLQYAHVPLIDQLNLGIRKIELDIFWTPPWFTVGHVQEIDMNSHCATLTDCLKTLTLWSRHNNTHVPIWISLNAKDANIAGLPKPKRFTAAAFNTLDQTLLTHLQGKLITPAAIKVTEQPAWPTLAASRGQFLVILDEGGAKRDLYAQHWRARPMFINVARNHPAAAVMIINDPVRAMAQIQKLVQQGYMVRTRADADTQEARSNDTTRREAAFKSGAQAVSTDYYLPGQSFDNDYVVKIPGEIRCNPISAGLLSAERCQGPFE